MMHSSESLATSQSRSGSNNSESRSRRSTITPLGASFHDIADSVSSPPPPTTAAPALLTNFWSAFPGTATTGAAPRLNPNARHTYNRSSGGVSIGSSFTSRGSSSNNTGGQSNNANSIHSNRSNHFQPPRISGDMGHPGRPSGSMHQVLPSRAVPPSPPPSSAGAGSTELPQQNLSHGKHKSRLIQVKVDEDDGATTGSAELADNNTILGSVASLTENPPVGAGLGSRGASPTTASSSMGFSFSHLQATESMLAESKGLSNSNPSYYASKANNNNEQDEDMQTVVSESLSLTPTMVLNGSGVITQSMVTATAANVGLGGAQQQQQQQQGQKFPVVDEVENEAPHVNGQVEEETSSRDGTDVEYDGEERLMPFLGGNVDDLGSLADIADEDFTLGAEENNIGPNAAALGVIAAAAGTAAMRSGGNASNSPAPPSTLEPDMVLCPFCQSEKDLKWHLNRERRQYVWAYRVFGAIMVVALMAGSFFAGSHSAKQNFEPVLASYTEQCQEKLTQMQLEHNQRHEQLLQLVEQQRLLIAEREEQQQVALRPESKDEGYFSYLTGSDDYVSALMVTAMGGIASGLSGVLTSYFLDGSGGGAAAC